MTNPKLDLCKLLPGEGAPLHHWLGQLRWNWQKLAIKALHAAFKGQEGPTGLLATLELGRAPGMTQLLLEPLGAVPGPHLQEHGQVTLLTPGRGSC